MTSSQQNNLLHAIENDTPPSAPVIATIPSLNERTADRRERLTRALAEIRDMDEQTAGLKSVVDAQRLRIGELEAMVAFLDKRTQDLDRDRLTYAKQAFSLARQIRGIRALTEEAATIADAADQLEQAGGAEKQA